MGIAVEPWIHGNYLTAVFEREGPNRAQLQKPTVAQLVDRARLRVLQRTGITFVARFRYICGPVIGTQGTNLMKVIEYTWRWNVDSIG